MKMKMFAAALVVTLLSMLSPESAEAQPRGRYYGNRSGQCAPGYAQPRRYNNSNGYSYRRPGYYRSYAAINPGYGRGYRQNCAPRYRQNNYYGGGSYSYGTTVTISNGYGNGYYGGYNNRYGGDCYGRR